MITDETVSAADSVLSGTQLEHLTEHVAKALCSASGEQWRAPPFNHLHTDVLNNHWRYKASKVLEAIDRSVVKPIDPAVSASVTSEALETVRRVLDDAPDSEASEFWVDDNTTLGAYIAAAIGHNAISAYILSVDADLSEAKDAQAANVAQIARLLRLADDNGLGDAARAVLNPVA